MICTGFWNQEELIFLSLRSALFRDQASKLGKIFWDIRYTTIKNLGGGGANVVTTVENRKISPTLDCPKMGKKFKHVSPYSIV